jgi:hypothetical protein
LACNAFDRFCASGISQLQSQGEFMQLRTTTAALAGAGVLVMLVAGCGGGGGGGGESTSGTPSTVALTTSVVDGALQNALVCLDANSNGVCDAGEVQGKTDASGNVTLQVAPADVGKYAIVAMVGTDAVDKDHGAVTTAYVLKAPADQTGVITPLTTLVQTHVEATGVSTTAAADFVKAQAGLSVSPLVDFSTSTAAGAAQAATLARLIVLTTQQQSAALSSVVGQTDLSGATVSQSDLNVAVNKAVLDALPTVAAAATDQAIATASDKNAALATAAQGLVTETLALDSTTALAAIGVAKLPTDTPSTMPTATAALRMLQFTDANNWYYRAMAGTAADNTVDSNGLIHYYDHHSRDTAGMTLTWGFNTNPARQNDAHWNGSAWVSCPSGFRSSQYPRDAQGRTTYNYCDGWETGTSVRSGVDISGQTLASVVTDKIRAFPGSDSGGAYASWGPADLSLLGSATFPAGSMLYYQTSRSLTTALAYDVQSSAVVTAYVASVAAGGDARTGSPACGAVTSANAATYQTQPSTLEDLVVLNPGTPCIYSQATNTNGTSLSPNEWWGNSTASMGSLSGALTQPQGTENYYTTTALLRVSFGANDAATYYSCYQRADASTRNCTVIGSGTYAIQTLGDARVMTFTGLPTLSQRMGWSRIFVERGGKLYYGYQNTPGTLTQNIRLNLPAANAVLSQLGLDPIVPN